MLFEYLDPHVIQTPAIRAVIKEHAPQRPDIVSEVNRHLWKVIQLNHLPSVRAYIEIIVIKFTLLYPQLSLEDPHFFKLLLDPNVKTTVASSFLVISGFVMTKLNSQQ